jgi:5-methylcytosine-specific restriction endonuclease McrA
MQKKARSNSEPEYYCRFQGWNYWRFKDRWYLENDGLKSDEVEALIRADQLKLNKKINEAKAASAADRAPDGKLREFIPKDVRLVVWKRDGGVCRHCGAAINLEFDHIIPVSLGGADSADNLQVLCQTCNRQKGASI